MDCPLKQRQQQQQQMLPINHKSKQTQITVSTHIQQLNELWLYLTQKPWPFSRSERINLAMRFFQEATAVVRYDMKNV